MRGNGGWDLVRPYVAFGSPRAANLSSNHKAKAASVSGNSKMANTTASAPNITARNMSLRCQTGRAGASAAERGGDDGIISSEHGRQRKNPLAFAKGFELRRQDLNL